MKEMFLNLENEILTGNVLDIGFDNYGIVYNMYKHFNDEIALEYYEDGDLKIHSKGDNYDSCVMMFTMNNIFFNYEKCKLVKEIYEKLKPDGVLILWDYEKPFMRICRKRIKVMVSSGMLKEININDFNILSNCLEEKTIKILEGYFEITYEKHSDEIYCIKAKKKQKCA